MTTLEFLVVAGVLVFAFAVFAVVRARRRGDEHAIVWIPMGTLGVYLFFLSVVERHLRWLGIVGVVLVLGSYAYQYLLSRAERERNRAEPRH